MNDHPPGSSPHPEFDVEQWLTSLQLGQYAASFAENNISLETLLHLTTEDLVELGVASLGHRKSLLRAIQKLTGGAPPAPPLPEADAEPGISAGGAAAESSPAKAPPPRLPAAPVPRSGPAKSPASPAPASVAPPAPPAPTSKERASRRRFWVTLAASKVFVISLIAHLLFGMGATYYIVQSIQTKRKVAFQGGPANPNRSKRALEHKVSMAQKKKTGGAPPQAKRIVSAGLAKVSLPEMPAMPSTTNVAPGMMSGMGGAGFGAGMGFGTGMGSGMGGGAGGGGPGISFFGLRASGKHIAFLLDYSGSMSGPFRKAMERELERALKSLPPGTQVLLIPWAGPAWLYNQTAQEIVGNWKVIDAYDNFMVRDEAKLEKPAWVASGPTTVEQIMKGIHDQEALPGGTDWRQPFRYVMKAEPPPDVIMFMTDGQIPPQTTSRALTAIDAALKKGATIPQVNCLYIENKQYNGSVLKELAAKYKGEYRQVSAGAASKK